LWSVGEAGKRGYYARQTYSNHGRLSAAQVEQFKQQVLAPVLAGSNLSDNGLGPMTGNASGKVAAHQFARGTPGYKLGRFWFCCWYSLP
jgi:hypothetical protein